MSVLFFLVPLALALAGAAVWAFLWAVRHGEFEDMQTPAWRVLIDDERAPPRHEVEPRGEGRAEEGGNP